MSKSAHALSPTTRGGVTPMTKEGVGDPLDLSPKGSEAHFKRFSGPGTRSKNPHRFDASAAKHAEIKARQAEAASKAKKKA